MRVWMLGCAQLQGPLLLFLLCRLSIVKHQCVYLCVRRVHVAQRTDTCVCFDVRHLDGMFRLAFLI